MREKRRRRTPSLRMKLIFISLYTLVLISVTNIFLYGILNKTISRIDTVYISNEELNQLSECLGNIQKKVYEYLRTKSSGALEDYYRYEQNYRILLRGLETDITKDPLLLYEKNIYNMSVSYLDLTEETVTAKRGVNVKKYKETYGESEALYFEIDEFIRELNDLQLQNNTKRYLEFRTALEQLVAVCFLVLLVILAVNGFYLAFMTGRMTRPITLLAKAANQVAGGDFTVMIPCADISDELGVLARAFNQMVDSIRKYIIQTKENYERESRLLENELTMKSELKDAQLKYLQAQINPHFLFNTLNAGAQLAMMEGAEKTCLFVENMADFFRYNVQSTQKDATIREEIELVDSYLYILNVRFAGEINFEKRVDERLLDTRMPSMILQPIVENAVNHGIRGVDWEGRICLTLYQEYDRICISIRDNGRGMDSLTIDKILRGEQVHREKKEEFTGIGMQNIMTRLRKFFDCEEVLKIRSQGENTGTEIILLLPFFQKKQEKQGEKQDV